jgi:5'-deoxynucleotidase YfbR-like HD superfamily hydrolase
MDFVEAWRSGTVRRYHTMEAIESNLVSQHSWGVVLLILMLWPDAPRQLLIAAELHDFGEKATGDMPGPVKWGNPVLESEMDRMERAHMKARLPDTLLQLLESVDEVQWGLVELCDRAEFCISMIQERMLGNKFTEIYYKRAWDKMTLVLEQFRDRFLAIPGVFDSIVEMRRNIDSYWREARK